MKALYNRRLCLVGNYSDSLEREVTTEEGQVLAESHGLTFYETSAKSGEGVTHMFDSILANTGRQSKVLDVEVMSQVSNQPAVEDKKEEVKAGNKTEVKGTKVDGDKKVEARKRVKLKVGIVGNSQSLAKKAFTHIIKMLSVMSKSKV